MATAAELTAVLPKLSANDQAFALSMLARAARKGDFSPGQKPYVDKLIARANAPVVAPTQVQVGSLSGILALFDKAREHLKFPAIVLTAATLAEPIRVSVAGPSSKFPGSINVVTQERCPATGRRGWLGRIYKDGRFEAGNAVAGTETATAISALLQRFAAAPAEVARESGRLNGRCCFCNIALTEERSTAVGYGSTCAKHYGLPWGND